MEEPEGRGFGTLSFDTSTDPEAWGLAYFDVYLCNKVLSSLRWKRWFLGLIGPRCTTAGSLTEAFEYIFGVSAVIAYAKPEFELEAMLKVTLDHLSGNVHNRAASVEGRAISFSGLYSDLLPTVCMEANLASSIVETAMESESGRDLLRGTKVPTGAALRVALQIAREGFIFGQMYADEARSLISSSRSFGFNLQTEVTSPEQHVDALVREWETQISA